ncbi:MULTISPECIES: GntR family transcriptional regulator [Paenibacillus]|jgi:DNA-binding transcriptional regulator YhcF (GntR family)|uniref:GntR family transcriptional regulator n=3 Tax=Paenibacillus TaxID=44249 RepID=A0A089M4H6_9BACL|nr:MULTISPECIES: GntR family transcriptional regulator [Paenibacillus]AIQ68681.1 GntR family transcriptional regulator [Paenibacillus graminis]KWX71041.1 GntR family transcriptional regulator [Paenibacillus riograndensis]MCE3200761.1 GntR family transcriptional regulator [Paenibacillus sonchi]MEC0170817.1 GntR family transcriptional regulator [Paenibacillus graminis]QQZ59557.1 GntR family transcriptional regulator [Paenibacillus sonchi]
MTIEFDNNQPIYLQIMNYMKGEIVTGKLKPGDKIPSVRELAAELQINPNTVQRTFQELERETIVETRRGMGRYVTGNEQTILTIKKEMAQDVLDRFIRGMQELGFQSEEILAAVAENIEIRTKP